MDSENTQNTEAVETAEISETERLKAELDVLQAELKAAKEKYIRLYADFDNFRKRSVQDLESAHRAGKFEAVRSLLGALDDLERALGFAQAKPQDLIPGVKTVLENFARNLKGMGVEPVPGVGSVFDPRLHEAIGAVEGEEGKVMHVYQQGFQYGDALVRPARVVVGNGVQSADKTQNREN
ncbi:MAG: nucleotide exchange factor GrpE [Thermaceae bacterium]|nr:nucleotide exchange factor GrpE [Thermaceae bacterium]